MVSTLVEATKTIDVLKSQHIDMIITDYKMPEIDGLTLTKQLRKYGYQPPIILLTSYKHELIEKQALDAGITLCIEKHVDTFQIYLEILYYLQKQNLIGRL